MEVKEEVRRMNRKVATLEDIRIGVQPIIKKIGFISQGKMSVEFFDGRKVVTPLDCFPSIEKLSTQQRKAWQIIDGIMFSFVDCDEVYHISQLLGNEGSEK